MLVPRLPSRNQFLVITVKTRAKADVSFLVISNFARFFYFLPNILSRGCSSMYNLFQINVQMDYSCSACAEFSEKLLQCFQRFFQLSLSVAELFHKLSFKCCLSVA